MWNHIDSPSSREEKKCTVSLSHFPVVFRSFTCITRLIVRVDLSSGAGPFFPKCQRFNSCLDQKHLHLLVYIYIMTTIIYICRESLCVCDDDCCIVRGWMLTTYCWRRGGSRSRVPFIGDNDVVRWVVARADHRFLEWPKNASHDYILKLDLNHQHLFFK